MLEALVQTLPRDLLRVIYAFYLEVTLQEHFQICRRLFLEFRDLEGQFQLRMVRYDKHLQYYFRKLLTSDTTWTVHDEVYYLNTLFREIGGHRDRAYRQLVTRHKKYAHTLHHHVNDIAYDICEQIWQSLYVLNQTPEGRRSLTWQNVEQSRVILTKEVHLVYLGIQVLPRYQCSKLQLLQYVVRRIDKHLRSWSFCFRRWLCHVPVVMVQLDQFLRENPRALQHFLTLTIQI